MATTGQLTGLVVQGIQLGVQSVLFRPARRIGNFVAQVTVEETHMDELEITDHPVEQGARISDHAYLRPAEITIRAGWSNSPSVPGFFPGLGASVTGTIAGVADIISGNGLKQVREIYQKLLELQTSRIPFSVVTGKRTYNDMLFRSLRVETNKETENSLVMTAVLRQVIIVKTQVIKFDVPKENQKQPEVTQPPVAQGQKQLTPAPQANTPAIAATIGATGSW